MGALINILFYSQLVSLPHRFIADPQSLLYLLLFFLLLATFFYQVFFRPIHGAVKNVSLVLFAVVYVAIPLSLVFGLRSLGDLGIQAILVAAASSFLADTGAYFAGTLIGRHNANIKVSPNKSIEGYAGGIMVNIAGTVLLIYLFDFLFQENFFSILEGVFLGFVLGVTGQLGDLIESAVKRDWGVKDSGFLIPGHGGILDLIDATLINIPLIWFYVTNF
jgi:phosphatidate cytidylyltransferase